MALGYDRSLYILAFDHRGSFQKKFFGISGEPNAEETETIADAKMVIFEGFRRAVEEGAPKDSGGILVDEQFGADIARTAKKEGFNLAMPMWKSEGIDTREDWRMIAEQTRAGGREGVACVVLGRGASDDAVIHWLQQGAGVPGYIGFAIGRTIWWDPLKAFVDGQSSREEAAE